MKILAVCGDVGGARCAIAVLNKISESGLDFVVSDNGFLGKEAPLEWPRVHVPDESKASSIDKFLSLNNVGLIIFTTSVKDVLPLRAARAGKRIGLPVICILDNWGSYRRRMEIDGLPAFYPDVYAVMDEHAFKDAVSGGIPTSVLQITGQPALASLAEDFKKYPGSNNKNKLIVFISEPAQKDQGGPESKYYRGYTEKTVLAKFCSCLQPYSGQIQVEILAHPREDKNALADIWEKNRGGLSGNMAEFKNTREAIFLADGAAGMASILMYEAWLIGKPLISLQPGLRRRDLEFMKGREGCYFLKDENLWEQTVSEWMAEVITASGEQHLRPDLARHQEAPARICEIVQNYMHKSEKK